VTAPTFISVEEVLDLHADTLRVEGGLEGLRDYGGLVSATIAPQNHWHYTGGDLFDLAAVLLVHLGRNHPLVDGNKRAAFYAALVFLDLNGIEIRQDDDALEAATLAAVQGKMDEASLADLFRRQAF
jgi:death-on-curing protein